MAVHYMCCQGKKHLCKWLQRKLHDTEVNNNYYKIYFYRWSLLPLSYDVDSINVMFTFDNNVPHAKLGRDVVFRVQHGCIKVQQYSNSSSTNKCYPQSDPLQLSLVPGSLFDALKWGRLNYQGSLTHLMMLLIRVLPFKTNHECQMLSAHQCKNAIA